MIKKIEFVDPNLPSEIEKILPSLLAQAIINKIRNENDKSESKSA